MSVVNKAVPGIVKLLRCTEEHEVTAQHVQTCIKQNLLFLAQAACTFETAVHFFFFQLCSLQSVCVQAVDAVSMRCL
jgi:hypothetical protein